MHVYVQKCGTSLYCMHVCNHMCICVHMCTVCVLVCICRVCVHSYMQMFMCVEWKRVQVLVHYILLFSKIFFYLFFIFQGRVLLGSLGYLETL